MAEDRWEQVAEIGVDAGIVWIGDPCYTMTPDTPFAFSNWQEFVGQTFEREVDGVARWTGPMAGDIGVTVTTGGGDGVYPVQVRRDAATGGIVELRVLFESSVASPETDDLP
jgi:hypothetical protein